MATKRMAASTCASNALSAKITFSFTEASGIEINSDPLNSNAEQPPETTAACRDELRTSQIVVTMVTAYGETILRGWGTTSPATNCYVYNSTFYMLGDEGLCASAGAAAMEDVTAGAVTSYKL